METKLDYELRIKGRMAKIGSKFFYKGTDEAIIESIEIDSEGWAIIFIANSSLEGIIENEIEETFFWEKKIIYQLPDTDGNLSEVKIGQHVWVKYKYGNVYKGVIYEFNGSDIDIMFICDNGEIYVSNKEGLSYSGAKATTSKPHRDFSDCMDWNHAPKDAIAWTVTSSGYSLWWRTEPHTTEDICWESGYEYGIHAGYRADLLNENGIV